jgi:hypothetical protein
MGHTSIRQHLPLPHCSMLCYFSFFPPLLFASPLTPSSHHPQYVMSYIAFPFLGFILFYFTSLFFFTFSLSFSTSLSLDSQFFIFDVTVHHKKSYFSLRILIFDASVFLLFGEIEIEDEG